MNCRENDLAVLIEDLWLEDIFTSERRTICAAGAIVRCVTLDTSDNTWVLEEPRRFQLVFEAAEVRVIVAGMLTAIRDDVLRPLRDPGDNAVDEVLVRVGAPNYGEVAHG